MASKIKSRHQFIIRTTVKSVVDAIHDGWNEDDYVVADAISAMACFFYNYVKNDKPKECLDYMKAIAQDLEFDFEISQEDLHCVLTIIRNGKKYRIMTPGFLLLRADSRQTQD